MARLDPEMAKLLKTRTAPTTNAGNSRSTPPRRARLMIEWMRIAAPEEGVVSV
jgi:hypothetical protein